MAMHIGLAKFRGMGFTALRQAIVTLDAAVLTPDRSAAMTWAELQLVLG